MKSASAAAHMGAEDRLVKAARAGSQSEAWQVMSVRDSALRRSADWVPESGGVGLGDSLNCHGNSTVIRRQPPVAPGLAHREAVPYWASVIEPQGS